MPRVRRRRSAKLLARSERGGSVAGAREPLDQAPVRVLGERVERDLLACQADRGRRIIRLGRELLEGLGEAPRVCLAGVVGPIVLVAVEDRRAAGLQSPSRVASIERRIERPRVDGEPGAVERDGLPGGDEMVRCRAERAAEFGERSPQAGAGRLVEHVGPEAGGELGAGMRARMHGEVGQQRPRATRGGEREHLATGAQRQPSRESDLQHAPTVAPSGPARKTERSTFTQAER